MSSIRSPNGRLDPHLAPRWAACFVEHNPAIFMPQGALGNMGITVSSTQPYHMSTVLARRGIS